MEVLRPSDNDLFSYFYKENLGPYQAFHRSTDFTIKTAQKIAQEWLDKIPQEGKSASILDIGSGGGEFAGFFLDEVHFRRPELSIHLVEADPSPKMLDLAKKLLDNLPPKVKISYDNAGVFPPPSLPLSKKLKGFRFDLIIASFILAWIKDWNNAIDQLLECLNTGGILCIVELSKEYGSEYAEFRRRIYEIAHQDDTSRRSFVENLEVVLREKGMEYDSEITCSKADFREDWSKGISETLEFFLRFPRRALTKEQIKEIKNCTIETFARGPLESCKKILWIKNNG